jgi:phospholipase C
MKLTDHRRRCIALATLLVVIVAGAGSRAGENQDPQAEPDQGTQTPIKHLVVMGYYDGNTVTALWNYAQAFAMSDNSYSTTFGPSTPGALNLISGQTHGFARAPR